MDWSAMTLPRIGGSARTWTIAVDTVMKLTLAKPSSRASGKAPARSGAAAKTSIAAPKAAAATTMARRSIDRRRAAARAPTRDPRLRTEKMSVKLASVPCRVRSTNSGMTTEKLNVSVPITATIARGSHRSGMFRT